MEEQILEENNKGSFELLGDGLKVIKSHWFKVLVIYLIQAVPMYYITYVKYYIGVSILTDELFSMVNSLLTTVAGIILTLLVLKTFDNGLTYTVSDVLKKIWVLCWTQLLLVLVIVIPSLIIFGVGIYLLAGSNAYTLIIPAGIVYILGIAFIGLKTAFITQAVTISNKKYWGAIKWSWQKSSEHVGTIFGIVIVPLMLLALGLGLVRVSMYSFTSVVMLMLVSLLMGIIIVIAIALLYIEQEMETEVF